MKYRYLIINEDSEVSGTNDQSLAQETAENNDTYVVIDSQDGKVLDPDGTTSLITEATPGVDDDQEEDEDFDRSEG